MKPKITTLYTDVVTLRQADETSQELNISRSAFIRQAIRNEVERIRAARLLPRITVQDPVGMTPSHS